MNIVSFTKSPLDWTFSKSAIRTLCDYSKGGLVDVPGRVGWALRQNLTHWAVENGVVGSFKLNVWNVNHIFFSFFNQKNMKT